MGVEISFETDVTPTKALGPVTQLIYGAMVPGNLAANIMGANVTGGVGLHAADDKVLNGVYRKYDTAVPG